MSRSGRSQCSGGRGCYVCGDAGEVRRAAEADAARADARELGDPLEELRYTTLSSELDDYLDSRPPRPHVGMAEHEATLPFATLGEAAARYGVPAIQVPTRAQQIAMAALAYTEQHDACPTEVCAVDCDGYHAEDCERDPTAIEGCPCCESACEP